MMHGHEKSDPEVVAIRTNAGGILRENPANKAALAAAELVERRAGTKGNADQQSTLRAQDRAGVSQALDRIRQAARHNKKERFTALLHHINPETLRLAFDALKKDAAPGVDGVTWSDYEVDLERRLEELHDRVHRGAYRPQPSRRVYIPKADGRQRPLAVAAIEDKIVQGAVAMVLSAIYEVDFRGFSYGFRPGRGQHDALDALVVGIDSRKVNWILDADIRSFFDMVDQKWMIRFVEHRIGDPRIIRLIRKWMKAGVRAELAACLAENCQGAARACSSFSCGQSSFPPVGPSGDPGQHQSKSMKHTFFTVVAACALAAGPAYAQRNPPDPAQPNHAISVGSAAQLEALGAEWDRIGFSPPSKPGQFRVYGQDGHVTDGPGYNTMV
jgi:RNA-directed DNA polymerase